ncbi:hypothetical protein ABFS82_06G146600 [Erythranthe guttata]
MNQKNYTILNENRIRQLQNNDISIVSTHLFISRGLAFTLLRRNNWSTNSVFDEWFSDEDKVRKSVGLLPAAQESLKPDNYLCKICFDKIEPDVKTLSCGPCSHPFCPDCWKSYVSSSIKDGPGCLSLRCPEPECKAMVGPEFVESLASEEDKDKYYRYLLRSYVEGSQNRKWCPGPTCDLAVQIIDGSENNYEEVNCDCSHRFCWNCKEEPHRPVDCQIVDKWRSENNDTWIRAFTKPCPKCGRNIEKNKGCNHMTCRIPCGHNFCWLCLGPWKHDGTHIYCKEYEDRDQEANTYYAFHYQKWASNHESRETAMKNLRRVKNGLIQNVADFELQFVIEALEQIVESRRVLKWSFAYGYYLPSTETRKIVSLHNLQEEAEAVVEKLQHFYDKEIVKYANINFPSDKLTDFRGKLVDMTNVTRNCIEKLVIKGLVNDVSEAKTYCSLFKVVVKSVTSCMFMALGSCCILRLMLEVF